MGYASRGGMVESLFPGGSFDFGLLPSCTWRVVADEGLVRYRGEETNPHLSTGFPLRSSAAATWPTRPDRGINNIELDAPKSR